MSYLYNNGIRNVVSFSGDLHAHIAGLVMDDYELFHNADTTQQAVPVVPEVVCAGISSRSQFSAVEQFSRFENPSELEQTVRSLIAYDGRTTAEPTDNILVNNLNNTLLNGVNSGLAAAATNSKADIEQYRDPLVNGHIKYLDTRANGYGLANVTNTDITVRLITIGNVNEDPANNAPQVKRTTEFTISKTTSSDNLDLTGPAFGGDPPFPFG
jgi:alkaline phosphatase D